MVGVVTRNEPELAWSEFDRAFFECKSASGRVSDPVSGGINTLSCFADNAAGAEKPELLAETREGHLASQERKAVDSSRVCPTHPSYREGLLEMIADAGAASGDVRLDDVGFPGSEYCHCERCDDAFEESEFDDRNDWRARVVTDFVREARERVPGNLVLSVHPDPYPGHLADRSGLDLAAIGPMIDEVVVPLYDTHYDTTYWLDALASGFADQVDSTLSIELYAVDVDVDALIDAATIVERHADSILYGFDASTARAAIRRRNADDQSGITHRRDGQ